VARAFAPALPGGKYGFSTQRNHPGDGNPLTSDGKINVESLRKLTNHLIDGGVHGLFPVGSQGEFYALTFEEKKRTIEVVVEEARGRVPVYAGTGAITTRRLSP